MTPAGRSNNTAKRGITKILLFLILCAICVALIFAAKNWMELAKARRLKNPVAATPAALADGKQIYAKHCENCHGESGDGKGEKAPELSTAPTDFTNAQKMQNAPDGELYWQTTKGRPPMPGFEDKLTEEQRWEVVDYIRTFAAKPATSQSAP